MITHDITIGGYIPGESVIHRLDPRIKLVGFVLILFTVFVSTSVQGVVSTIIAVTGLVLLTRTGCTVWVLGFRRFLWMLLVVSGLNLFFGHPGAPLIFCGFELPFSTEALTKSLVFLAQLVEAIALAMVLTFTTAPSELAKGIGYMAHPLKRFSIPVENMSTILLLAMRFVPMLQEELKITIDAQKSRGVEFEKGKVLTRSRNLVALLAPVFMGALRRADLLAVAMTARGFRSGGPRSEFRPLKFTIFDYVAGGLIIVFFVFCLAMRQWYGPGIM